MPLTMKCKGCGCTLFKGEVGMKYSSKISLTDQSTPTSIYNEYKGRCPKCRRRLEMPNSKDIRIYIYSPSKKEEGGESI